MLQAANTGAVPAVHLVTQTHQPPDHALQTVASQVVADMDQWIWCRAIF